MPNLSDEIATQRRKVDFDTYDISVQQLLSMVEQGTIDIAPEYQRHFRWNELQQSQLVESVFLGLPVPSLFMATNKDGTWEVVDGVQRLSTLVHFAGDKKVKNKIKLKTSLRLDSLDKIPSLNSQSFLDLPQTIQLQFLLRPIKVITLSDKSDTIVRFDLFERLNTGGVKLTDQEIRACVFRGEFNDFLQDLAGNTNFRSVVTLPPARREDRTDEELVLRFFAFLYNYNEFDHSVVEFLNDYMREASTDFDYQVNRRVFEATFAALADIFPDGIRRESRKSTPVNLYEGVAVGAALAYWQNGKIPHLRRLGWVTGEELKAFTTGATNQRNMVKGRIELCARKFGWTEWAGED